MPVDRRIPPGQSPPGAIVAPGDAGVSAPALAGARVAAESAAPVLPPITPRERTLALAGTLLALLLAGLDQTIVATAGPEIQRGLGIPAALYAWITTSYLIGATVMLPIWGKLSDLYGRKPILLAGVGLFLLGSLLSGLAPTTGFLIGARLVQGLGAASLFTSTLAVIGDLYPPNVRGKYMGLIGGVMGISSVAGPLVGGVITELLGWQWVFFVNLPLGGVAIWLIATRMPRMGVVHAGALRRIDFAGAAWIILTVVPLLTALSLGRGGPGPHGTGFAWGSAPIAALLAAAALGAVLFLLRERRAPEPILELRLFREPVIGRATATTFVLGAAFLFSVIFLPLYLVHVVGITAAAAGLSLVPLTMAMVVGSVGAGHIAARVGRTRALLSWSLALLVVAFGLMAFTLTPDTSAPGVMARMALVGLAIGPSLPLYTLIIQNAARQSQLGVVTAAATFSRSLGQVVGITLFGTIFAASLARSLDREVTLALADLSPAARMLVVDAVPALARAGEAAEVAFDADAVRARLRASTAPADPAELAAALVAVDHVDAAFRHALTHAIRTLYRLGMLLIVLALALTLTIPDRRLRTRMKDEG
jgi:EmrB/QacA subfamily drug resistance transporter